MSSSPTPPTPSSVKLFVGQVSRTMTEDDVAQIFSPYGNLLQTVIIRDRLSQAHRGCAFVTYETQQQADAAVAALHGVYRCEGMPNPLQIAAAMGRVATSQPPRGTQSNKLYVGGFSAACDVDRLTTVFSRFGTVIDVSILKHRRSSDNLCCAFIKFPTRDEARAAIEGLVGSTELDLENGSTPLVVKYAENRERSAWPAYSGVDYWSQVAPLPMYNPFFIPMGGDPGALGASAAMMGQYSSRPMHAQFGLASVMGGLSLGPGGMGGIADGHAPSASTTSPPLHFLPAPPHPVPTLQNIGTIPSSGPQPPGGSPLHLPLPPPSSVSASDLSSSSGAALPPFRYPGVASPQDFCTVYVYNLPLDWTDEQLRALGSRIGALQRATVCVNRATGTSKGYGFIVFEDPKYVPLALQTICSTSVGPDHYLSAQMSHASMSMMTSAFVPPAIMPPSAYMNPHTTVTGSRGRGGRFRPKTDAAARGGRHMQKPSGGDGDDGA